MAKATTKKGTEEGKAKKTAAAESKTPKAAKPVKIDEASYSNQSISQLKGADRVRKRPAVIFGSDGLEGCEHAFFEILSNSVDEAREGHGKVITVRVYRDGTLEVVDRGRGVPMDYNEKEGQWNWFLIFCELYAGGKYNNNEAGAAYEYSLGLNGLGACATQYASEFMYVRSCDGRNISEMNFKKGEPDGELMKRPCGRGEGFSGTTIRWRPDLEVFKEIIIPREHFIEVLKRQAVVNTGVLFEFFYEEEDGKFTEERFVYDNGIVDRLKELGGDTLITEPISYKTETSGRDREDLADYKLKYEVAFAFSNGNRIQEYYHNSSYLEHGGSSATAVKNAFHTAFNKYLTDKGKYKQKETHISQADVEESLVVIVNSFSTQTSYANQTKKAITNEFIKKAMTESIRHWLERFFAEHPEEAEKAAKQILLNKQSREAADSAKKSFMKGINNPISATSRVEKFVNCRSKDKTVRELFIVEGDSALTSCKLGRSAEFQAIIPVRGKTINCIKSTYAEIMKSEIVVNLLRVIGCGVEIKTKKKDGEEEISAFDINKLNWSKIIICTDADEDGFQIRTLVLSMFYRLLPTLLRQGKVYIAESPLFEITTKEDTYFAYDEKEKVQILKELDERKLKYTLQRSKGLGENDPDMMWRTTMSPQTRRLIRVCEADAKATFDMFQLMLGKDTDPRRAYIAKHGHKYIADADVQ